MSCECVSSEAEEDAIYGHEKKLVGDHEERVDDGYWF